MDQRAAAPGGVALPLLRARQGWAGGGGGVHRYSTGACVPQAVQHTGRKLSRTAVHGVRTAPRAMANIWAEKPPAVAPEFEKNKW